MNIRLEGYILFPLGKWWVVVLFGKPKGCIARMWIYIWKQLCFILDVRSSYVFLFLLWTVFKIWQLFSKFSDSMSRVWRWGMVVLCYPASYVGLLSTVWNWVVDVMHGKEGGEVMDVCKIDIGAEHVLFCALSLTSLLIGFEFRFDSLHWSNQN